MMYQCRDCQDRSKKALHISSGFLRCLKCGGVVDPLIDVVKDKEVGRYTDKYNTESQFRRTFYKEEE